MEIFTSYFAVARSLDPDLYFVVSISRFPPRWFSGLRCLSLAPSKDLLFDYKSGLSEAVYTRRYRHELSELFDLREVFQNLAMFSKGRDMVLCCYEKSGEFCHRHILSDIVFEKYGYRINELVLS